MLIWGLSSGRMTQQYKKKFRKKEEKREQKKLLEHKHKNTNKNGEAYEKSNKYAEEILSLRKLGGKRRTGGSPRLCAGPPAVSNLLQRHSDRYCCSLRR